MYEEYAKDPRMKLNLGIRRRLAPLLDGGRDEIALMHAILFSLPGSPVLYYGDEIAMGDNVYLGDRDGPYGDYYVWSDTDDRWEEARIIFLDSEPSNWTWDPVRGQYYWHRFFHHQPDLNYDNPEVEEAMLDVLRFWLDLGLDGFRLDAVPYLYEEEGTNCENLPRTHEYLKRVRAEIDANYPDRVLLAEANQWPEDVVAYFGDGDECHMAFHFPVMPRMFMSLRREEALPMIEILDRTPQIPDNAQWGLFLRNHDELTLEMVTDEERDSWNHGCSDDVWFMTRSAITRMPRSCACSTKVRKSSSVP